MHLTYNIAHNNRLICVNARHQQKNLIHTFLLCGYFVQQRRWKLLLWTKDFVQRNFHLFSWAFISRSTLVFLHSPISPSFSVVLYIESYWVLWWTSLKLLPVIKELQGSVTLKQRRFVKRHSVKVRTLIGDFPNWWMMTN